MISYLDAGGSVYFEGNDIGYNNKSYDIWEYTGLTYVGDGAAATTGNVQNITGHLMCNGIQFNYPYKSEADGYVDDFSPNGGALVFTSQDSKGRVGCYTGSSGNYRTITSSVFFSVFQENGTTRQELMAVYREFLLGGTGIAHGAGAEVAPVSFSVVNPGIGSFSATLELPGETQCDVGVFDLSGRNVGTLVNGTVASGASLHTYTGENLSAGTYLVSGFIGSEWVSRRVVLLK